VREYIEELIKPGGYGNEVCTLRKYALKTSCGEKETTLLDFCSIASEEQ
jgi:hypothetical protein